MGLFDSLKKMFGGNSRYYHDQLGLGADEDFRTIVTCALWHEPNAADQAEAVALGLVGLFTGHTVTPTGVQATVAITTAGRLVVGMIHGRNGAPLSFSSGTGLSLADSGRRSPEQVMGPAGYEPGVLLALRSPRGEVFKMIVPSSKMGEFVGWT